MLVDRVTVHLQAGNGGNGCESFECRGHKKYFPIGGDGGKGGDIIFKTDNNLKDLEFYKFHPHQRAEHGTQGGSNKKKGKQGKDMVLHVPIGTIVYSTEGGYLLRDLSRVGDEFVVARGGFPGRGNHDNKTPSHGKPGEALSVILDYQIDAPVVFVGLPNSGKSLLLSSVTRAKVKSTEYPYATRFPQLGSIEFDDYSRAVVCDLPSIAKGADEGKGMGNAFLKHALRAKVVCVVLEAQSDFAESLIDAYQQVCSELKLFDERLLQKQQIVLINKCDETFDDEAQQAIDAIKKQMPEVCMVSALDGTGMDTFTKQLAGLLKQGA